ncbi:MAG: hypothetical protein H0W86_02375 [Armatimonadetes bacterium]|nr:hypothetical protein [Armatimonadota bacterium]
MDALYTGPITIEFSGKVWFWRVFFTHLYLMVEEDAQRIPARSRFEGGQTCADRFGIACLGSHIRW